MKLANHDEYSAAVQRAAALSDAPEGTEQAAEFRTRTEAIHRWNEEHKGEHGHGPEAETDLLRPDDLPFSGLPGNLGKLKKS